MTLLSLSSAQVEDSWCSPQPAAAMKDMAHYYRLFRSSKKSEHLFGTIYLFHLKIHSNF